MSAPRASLALRGAEEIDVVNDLFVRAFRTLRGRQGLWYRSGRYLLWSEGKAMWLSVEPDDMISQVYLTLDGAQYTKKDPRDGKNFLVPYKVTATKAKAITRGLQAKTMDQEAPLPRWMDGGAGRPPPQRCIPFEDKVLEITEEGELKEWVRDENWLGVGVVPCKWDPEAECPTFMSCLEEWSNGDPAWVELLQRWCGYVMLGHRKHERWMLLQGMIRGGKSTCIRVMEWLVGGEVCGGTISQLADPFFRTELATARLLSIGEITKVYRGVAGEVAGIIKSCVGQDRVSIAVMYGAKTSVRPNAAVCMASNLVPDLPDQGRGLTGKMLVLPFQNSFVGKEDPDLEEKLKKELSGIAAWAVKGAVALEMASSKDRWPKPQGAVELAERLGTLGNVFEGFLKARFQKNPTGFVSGALIKGQWADYLKKNKLKLQDPVPGNQLIMRLETETSWGLQRDTSWKGDDRGSRGLRGLSLLKETNDEV